MKKQTAQKPLSNTELYSFCNQMALILKSGISSIEGISIMLEESEDASERAILQTIYDSLIQSGNFADSLESAGVFPSYMLHMSQIGEQTGKLDNVMHALSKHYEREENIARSVKNAVTYPLIMITMMAVIVLILLTKVMPIFNQVFAQLGQEMTGFSKALLSIGSTISSYSSALIVVLVIIVGSTLFFSKTTYGKNKFRRFSSHFGFFRKTYDRIASCRFADCMALTLGSGFNPEYCMELASNLIEDTDFQEKIKQCLTRMSEGCEFSAALTQTGIFSGVYGRMISLASRTGGMDTVMQEIAEKYEEEIDSRLFRLISVIEPTLVIFLSVIVGIILLSVMLPLMGIMSSL